MITGGGGSTILTGRADAMAPGGGMTDTTLVVPPAGDAPAPQNAAPTPMIVIAGATRQARGNQHFMVLARGWTVAGRWRHLSQGCRSTTRIPLVPRPRVGPNDLHAVGPKVSAA